MKNDINAYITKSAQADWKPLIEQGVNTRGIFVKVLRYDENSGRAPSILLKFEPGARYPFHNHPGGEDLIVLKGSCFVNETLLNEGDYLYTPPGFKHFVRSENGCELMLVIPEEVEILEKAEQ